MSSENGHKQQRDTVGPVRRGWARLLAGKGGASLTTAVASLRRDRLRYMLIFSLAPIFPHMKNSLVSNADRILGMDAVFTMGIAYSLGIGLIVLLAQPERLPRFARALGILTALLFAAWVIPPLGPVTPWVGMCFSLALGACSGIALFGFTYALNGAEQLLGAGITVLFCMVSQIILSLPPLQALSGPLYLGAQVVVTLACLFGYRQADYAPQLKAPKAQGAKPLAVALYFFFAHRAIVFFYSYLSHAPFTPLVGLAGIAVFLASMYVFFAFRFNTWHLCNLFFAGMLISYALRLDLPPDPCASFRVS